MKTRTNSSPLNSMILLGFIMIVIAAAIIVLGKREQGENLVIFSGAANFTNINVQFIGINSNSNVKLTGELSLPTLSQRDKSQYNSDGEFKTWSPSACSATAVAALLNGYGKNVRTVDVLNIMRDEKAISASAGLYDYSVFAKIAAKYGMRANLSEDRNLDAHFNRILANLKQGVPMVVNIQDPVFFPNGHFIVAVRLSPDSNSVFVVNPDPAPGRTVGQEWPVDTFKTYFSRSLRSVVFTSV